MPDSVYSAEVQTVLDRARASAGQPGGPFPSPEDWRDRWIYFLMMDRFNNPVAAPTHQPFDDPSFSGFQGGKFSGVTAQLPYIKGLGAGALWLSPVLKNLQWDPHIYHGYGIHDFLRAEPRFADRADHADDELRALVDAAHQQGLSVVLDIVLNHTGNVFAYNCRESDQHCHDTLGSEAEHSETPLDIEWRDENGVARPDQPAVENIGMPSHDAVVWPRELQQNRYFRRQGAMGGTADDTVGDFASLKQMMSEDRDVQRFLIRSYQYVIARFDIDGFRIDTLRYLKGGLARTFGNAVREFALSIGKENFFTFGEVFDSRAEEDIARFIGRNTASGDDIVGVDAALDYPLFNTLKPVTKGFVAPAAVVGMYQHRKDVERNIVSSHGDATRFFVTFLDNHDVKERIRHVAPGDDAAPPTGFDPQVTLGLACLFSLPGIPCVYYGTEQGLHGFGSDEAVREALWGGPGFKTSGYFYKEIARIAEVRSGQPALRYGRFYFRPISGDGQNFAVSSFLEGVLAYSRILNEDEVLVVANTSTSQPEPLRVIVDGTLHDAGSTFHVLYSSNLEPTPPAAVEQTGAVTVQEVDGTTGHGPLKVLPVTLQPMEVQVLRP
ncbi:MAG TPA: alpha-amylase family glycosyl hydrolase [Actinomycetota bacterium]